jgi:hypothetical protein
VGVAVLQTVGANEFLTGLGEHILRENVHRVAVVAAFALERSHFGHVGLQPLGDGPGQNAAALAEGALGMESPQDGFPDEPGLVREIVEDFGQVMIDTERHDGLFLLGHQIS